MPLTKPEERVLIIAPVGQDAAAMAALLQAEGFQTYVCSGPAESAEKIRAGAGVLLLTEEALELAGASALFDLLKAQPSWSELPLIILTSGGEPRLARLLGTMAEAAGSVTVLERPMSGATLLRSVQVALRSRRRQYQVRDLISQQRQDHEALRETKEELSIVNAELEKRVEERTAQLRATNEQLETFVYSAAHDLRSPLRSINAYSQLLIDDHAAVLPERPRQLLERIHASSEFMDKLLLDLLAFGRTARSEMELGPVEVQTAWERAVFQSETQIQQTQARIQVAGPLPKVRAHEATLTQILANLLSNALKFVAPGTRPSVRFWAEDRGNQARLWLQDNGIGIPQREQERVFRVFERLNGTRYPGTGIGLSIVRKGSERMAGKTGLESEPGQGTRFWIELPKVG
jgi:signal transduction histidine kinase